MGLLRECDIYPGRTKDVRKFQIVIQEIKEDGKPAPCAAEFHEDRHMCPAALKRAKGFFGRGTKAPGK